MNCGKRTCNQAVRISFESFITEIQDFIRSLDTTLPVDQLTAKRDFIKEILASLSRKEVVEFNELLGKYFPDLGAGGLSEGRVA